MAAYYNEIDPYAAQWLRNLIDAGHIAPGTVDERSIEDVRPDELTGFTQCHFFAGIGVWSLALRRAGWPDDRSIWTGSCPCQPFSTAGEGAGFADERHLWPAFFHLIAQCRPAVVAGEQVASKDAEPWVDLVCDDLGSLGYASGALAFPSSSVGAPHIRDRLYWVADSCGRRLEAVQQHGELVQAGRAEGIRRRPSADAPHGGRDPGRMAIAHEGQRRPGRAGAGGARGAHPELAGPGAAGGLADPECIRVRGEECGEAGSPARGMQGALGERERLRADDRASGAVVAAGLPGPTNGFWRSADWLACRDERWRPVEPGTFPLAHGTPARVGRLRAYGNAINAEAARVFIECVMEAA